MACSSVPRSGRRVHAASSGSRCGGCCWAHQPQPLPAAVRRRAGAGWGLSLEDRDAVQTPSGFWPTDAVALIYGPVPVCGFPASVHLPASFTIDFLLMLPCLGLSEGNWGSLKSPGFPSSWGDCSRSFPLPTLSSTSTPVDCLTFLGLRQPVLVDSASHIGLRTLSAVPTIQAAFLLSPLKSRPLLLLLPVWMWPWSLVPWNEGIPFWIECIQVPL